ncbi:MAG TPA: protein-tyrosine phosphatase family protein [Pseudolabrys sp.]|nr:protein-tyrosine phosphatase family protein [Pseudolabrys sp.]
MIHVCSLARLHQTVDDTGARHVVTLLRDPEIVARPKSIAPENHLILHIDDIAMPIEGYTVPEDTHVRELLAFVHNWDRAAPMVVHCYAGISRSTAGAFVTACALNPARDELDIAWDIRRASRTAKPNVRIVSLADTLLGRNGRMVRAIEVIGPGEVAYEGDPFRLDLHK